MQRRQLSKSKDDQSISENAMMDMGIVKIKIDIFMAFPRPGLQ